MRTIRADGEVEIVVNKSRFVCAVARAGDEATAREFIAVRRKRYHDATHNCTAYVLGENGEIARSNDDGEPAGTAGVPILEVLRRRELTNAVAVVTRYFGGVKLGAGGLIRAYGSSVAAALNAVGTASLDLVSIVTVTADYQQAGKLEADLRSSDWQVLDTEFGDDVRMRVAVADVEEFVEWVSAHTGGEVTAEVTGTKIIESP